jgi:hypothetical protein
VDSVLDICTDALVEIGAYGPDNLPLTAEDGALALRILNRKVDKMAARKVYVYNISFQAFTLTPNHAPHLIGPGLVAPDFAATQRPMRIEGAALILNTTTPNVDAPIRIRDDEWWKKQSVKGLKTAIPKDLYYSPDWPNGALNFWPVPTFAYGVRLELWGLIPQFVALTDAFNLPPGYKDALVLTLAEACCRPWGRPLMPDLVADAAKARADIQTANISSPRIASADYGTSGRARGGFNYYTGGPA